jgi:hypothetical protein
VEFIRRDVLNRKWRRFPLVAGNRQKQNFVAGFFDVPAV